MKSKFQLKIIIAFILINNTLLYNAYFKCELFCVDNYADYIISSEGIIPPINPSIYLSNFLFPFYKA